MRVVKEVLRHLRSKCGIKTISNDVVVIITATVVVRFGRVVRFVRAALSFCDCG